MPILNWLTRDSDIDTAKRMPVEDGATAAIAAKAEPAAGNGRKGRKGAGKPETAASRPLGKRAAIEAAAREGKPPEPPDFSAETHKRFRNKLAVELAKAGDLRGLRARRFDRY